MSEDPWTAASPLHSRSIITLPGRILKSLRIRGLKSTLRYIQAYAHDALFDLRYGVRTDRWVALRDLEIVGHNRHQGKNYQPVKASVFRSAIDAFQIPRDGVFVDYGSGKGRVLMLAVLYGFKRTVGIEFAQDLCVDADRNLDRFRNRTRKQFEARVLNVDAACYRVDDEDSIFSYTTPSTRRFSNTCSATSGTRFNPVPFNTPRLCESGPPRSPGQRPILAFCR